MKVINPDMQDITPFINLYIKQNIHKFESKLKWLMPKRPYVKVGLD